MTDPLTDPAVWRLPWPLDGASDESVEQADNRSLDISCAENQQFRIYFSFQISILSKNLILFKKTQKFKKITEKLSENYSKDVLKKSDFHTKNENLIERLSENTLQRTLLWNSNTDFGSIKTEIFFPFV